MTYIGHINKFSIWHLLHCFNFFYVLIVGNLQSLILVFKGVAINLQFSMSKDFKIFSYVLKLVETNNSFLLVSHGFWPLLGFQGKMWVLLNPFQIPTIRILHSFYGYHLLAEMKRSSMYKMIRYKKSLVNLRLCRCWYAWHFWKLKLRIELLFVHSKLFELASSYK